MTQASIGYGSKFALESTPGSGVYVNIAEIDDLTPPNQKADVLDATNFDSPNGFKEFIIGMTDPGELKAAMNFVPGSASETLILAAQASRVSYGARITFPAGQVWTFSLLVSGKVSGSIVRA